MFNAIIPAGAMKPVRRPWWSPPRKQTRTPKWCKLCGRKHSRLEGCELYLHKDLTVERRPFFRDEVMGHAGKPVKRVGFWSTREKSGESDV